jgi:hypothetical protein
LTPIENVVALTSFATLSELMSASVLYRVSAVFAPGDGHSLPPGVAKPGAWI